MNIYSGPSIYIAHEHSEARHSELLPLLVSSILSTLAELYMTFVLGPSARKLLIMKLLFNENVTL